MFCIIVAVVVFRIIAGIRPPPLVMSFAAQSPRIARHLLVSHSPSSPLSRCLLPACLASSTAPSCCVIHCLLTPNILYLNLIVAFPLSLSPPPCHLHRRGSIIDCCVPALITHHRRCQTPFSPLPPCRRTPTPLSKATAHCPCRSPPSFCVLLCVHCGPTESNCQRCQRPPILPGGGLEGRYSEPVDGAADGKMKNLAIWSRMLRLAPTIMASTAQSSHRPLSGC